MRVDLRLEGAVSCAADAESLVVSVEGSMAVATMPINYAGTVFLVV